MLDKIEDAIKDIQNGQMVIVVDDENRENEGDLVCAAENANYSNINKMTKLAKGLICVPMSAQRAAQLKLSPMVDVNTDANGTAFTVSVDAYEGTTTGISVGERLKTIHDLANADKKAADFRRPGHLFPLIAREGGVLVRDGHTEAAVDLAKLAGLSPVGVICEILNDDGTMARLPQLQTFAKEHDLKIISIEDLIHFRQERAKNLAPTATSALPTQISDFNISVFTADDGKEHVALVKGDVSGQKDVLIRIHSECLTGDVFSSLRCDCGEQLDAAMRQIDSEGAGMILYLRQEGRGIGLANKIKAYTLQEQGYDTLEANHQLGFPTDMRDYDMAVTMLKHFGIESIRLISNNPLKIKALSDNNITISDIVQLQTPTNEHNAHYLRTKKEKMNHSLKM